MTEKMSDEQKYMELLKAIGQLLAENNRTIWLANYEITSLKEKLAEAEATIEELKKGETNNE